MTRNIKDPILIKGEDKFMLLPFLSLSLLSLSLSLSPPPSSLSLSHLISLLSSLLQLPDVILHHLPPSLPEAQRRGLIHLFLPRLLPFLSKHKTAAKKVQIIKKTSEFKAAGKQAARRAKREREIYLSSTKWPPPWCSLQYRPT